MSSKIVNIVHCIDTEGPLFESLEATFLRLHQIFDIDLEPTHENLVRLRSGALSFGHQTAEIAEFLREHNITNHPDWRSIDAMLAEITRAEFRQSFPDSFGKGWIYNWFCMDHVGYAENPRKRDLGHHHIFDRYHKLLQQANSECDSLGFHYHPLPYNRQAHSSATFYFNQNHIYEILARKVIDRLWFPSVFRPGFHVLRPDSNWFLEQWIPFDFSNQATRGTQSHEDQHDGRWGDWRRAPEIWGAYHPDPDDYQRPGNSRRWIFRCLNMQARLRQLEQVDVDAAFEQAVEQGSSVLAFTDHDFRDMKSDIIRTYQLIKSASQKYPDVKFQFKTAADGVRDYLKIEPITKIGFQIAFTSKKEGHMVMHLKSKHKVFGPQPFLAVKTKDGQYFFDNFDFDVSPLCWHYTFDWQTFAPNTIEKIGVAAAHDSGLAEVLVYDFENNTSTTKIYG